MLQVTTIIMPLAALGVIVITILVKSLGTKECPHCGSINTRYDGWGGVKHTQMLCLKCYKTFIVKN